MLKNHTSFLQLKNNNLLLLLYKITLFSSVFQAAVIWNFKSFPLTVFYFLELLFFMILIVSCIFNKICFVADNKLFLAWMFFFSICIISMLFPLIFSGYPVLNPRLGIDSEVYNQSSLNFSISNIGQIIYTILNSAMFLFCCCDDTIKKKK